MRNQDQTSSGGALLRLTDSEIRRGHKWRYHQHIMQLHMSLYLSIAAFRKISTEFEIKPNDTPEMIKALKVRKYAGFSTCRVKCLLLFYITH